MRKTLLTLAAAASCLLFIVIVIGSLTIVAQSTITGEWHGSVRTDKPDRDQPWKELMKGRVNIEFDRWRNGNNHSSIGMDFSPSELGLTDQQVQNGNVAFRLVREAGTVDAQGTFTDGKGSGKFTFTPNLQFVADMKSRGFDFERPSSHSIKFNKSDDGENTVEERLLSAALLNVTIALADDLNSANFGKLDVDDLFKAAIFHVDSKFMAEMKNTGFPNLTFDDLVKARIFKIDADYVRQVNEMGLGIKDFEGLVKYRIFKVTPDFLAELKNAGLTNLNDEEVVKCRIFHIDGDFVRKARATDPNATVDDMVRMKIGVSRIKVDTWQ
ncbi:MAG: hypothetical protein JO314_05950 [Acidobacteria bacterium]|nr:hypothetical protein [Acidobacteriota bacterium]